MTQNTLTLKKYCVSPLATRRAKSLISLCILIAIVILCCVGISSMNYANTSDFSSKLLVPSPSHIFGTDNLGRDAFLRTLSGLSMSILTGIITTIISSLIALIFAVISSSKFKFASNVVDILCDLTIGIPHIILLILISFALGKGAFGVTAAIALTHWPTLSRLLRAEILKVRASDYYNIAMKCLPSLKTSLRQIVPAIAPQLVVGSALCFPHAILHESTLTFLGFGFSPETPAIGVILSESLTYLASGYWWVGVLPGISLVLVVLCVRYLFGTIKDLAEC